MKSSMKKDIENKPVPLDERIKIQEAYIDGLRKLRDNLSKSIVEANIVLQELLADRARKQFEDDLLALDNEAARMTNEGGKGGNNE